MTPETIVSGKLNDVGIHFQIKDCEIHSSGVDVKRAKKTTEDDSIKIPDIIKLRDIQWLSIPRNLILYYLFDNE